MFQDSIYGIPTKIFWRGSYQQINGNSNQMEKDYRYLSITNSCCWNHWVQNKWATKTHWLTVWMTYWPTTPTVMSSQQQKTSYRWCKRQEPQKAVPQTWQTNRTLWFWMIQSKDNQHWKGFQTEWEGSLFILSDNGPNWSKRELATILYSPTIQSSGKRTFDLRVKERRWFYQDWTIWKKLSGMLKGIDKDEDMQKLLAGKKHRSPSNFWREQWTDRTMNTHWTIREVLSRQHWPQEKKKKKKKKRRVSTK